MHRRHRLVVLVLALLLAALPAAARQDLTLDQILEKHYAAIGTEAAWKKLQGMKQVGKMSMAGMEAPFTAYAKRPNKQRAEFEIQGMKGVQVFDGKDGWMVLPFMGSNEPQPMPQELVDVMATSADIDGVLVDYKAKGHQIELLGREDLEGTPVYRLRVKLASGRDVDHFLDAEHFVTLQTKAKATVQGSEMEIVTKLSNYKPVGGLMVPYTMSTSSAMGEQIMTVDTVELDPALDDALFAKPAAAPPGAH